MVLSYLQLQAVVKQGYITNVTPDLLNGTSIDITLGDTILEEEHPGGRGGILSLKDKDQLKIRSIPLPEEGYLLPPGKFILAHSQQQFHLPLWLSAEYKLKSSMARMGLEHLNAGWCDPGWHDSVLTLELYNCSMYHSVLLQKGDRIGQVVFFQHVPVPDRHSYKVRGRYNGDQSVSGVKKDLP